MECPSSPECVAPARGDSDRGSVCDGVRMDGKREHQRVREGKSQRGSFGTCEFLVRDPRLHLSLTIARLL